MSTSSNFSDFFNGASGIPSQNTERNTEIYSPKFSQGQNNVYTATIRFIPFINKPSASTISKWQSYVTNPATNMSRTVDNYSDANSPSPITNLYFRMKNTKIQTYIDAANKLLKSNLYHFSLVQIIDDKQHPEYNGTIKVFRYGKGILDKIIAENDPKIPGQTGINPFDIIHGRYFYLHVEEKAGFNNYDKSVFFTPNNQAGQPLPTGALYADSKGATQIANDQMTDEQKAELVNYFSKNSPDLSKYDYRPWSDEDRKFITEALATIENYINTGSIGTAQQNTLQNGFAALSNPAQPTAPTGFTFPGATVQPAAPAAPVAPTAPAAPVTPGSFNPITNTVTPAAPAVPGIAPGFSAPQPTVPVLNQAAPVQAAPSVGINVDDVLNQL